MRLVLIATRAPVASETLASAEMGNSTVGSIMRGMKRHFSTYHHPIVAPIKGLI